MPPEAISNTSPLLYLYRIDGLNWLPKLFYSIWVPQAVADEFKEGRRRGYDVPDLALLVLTLACTLTTVPNTAASEPPANVTATQEDSPSPPRWVL